MIRVLGGWLAALVLAVALCAPLSAQVPAQAQAQTTAAPPQQVEELMRLLQDPAVKAWIESRGQPAQAPPTAAPGPGDGVDPLHLRLAEIRAHVAAVTASVPNLPAAIGDAASRIGAEIAAHGPLPWLAGLGIVLAILFAAAPLAHLVAGRANGAAPAGEPKATSRLLALARNVAGEVAAIAVLFGAAFALTVSFGWPPLARQIMAAFAIAALILAGAAGLTRILLTPIAGGDAALVPMTAERAAFWRGRILRFVAWFAFGWAIVQACRALGFQPPMRQLVAYALGIGLLAIALETVWTHARLDREADPDRRRSLVARLAPFAATLACLALWLFWVAGAMRLFWFLAVAILLPVGLRLASLIVARLFEMARSPEEGPQGQSIRQVSLERGMRALLIVGAAFFLGQAWGVDLTALAARDTLATRLVRGALNAVVIVLVADFLWHLARAVIDSRIAAAAGGSQPDLEEARRRARLRTLLPIIRNMLLIVIVVVSLLMVLAALGIEIGPLIAGAGVIGVAIGFGAQTLVKDIISGVFYLLDDAFRVGEYIQSGSYRGTVESFSLRSVKLRHHRGPLYTVPFGQLGAVQNMSRDWVIDKLTINITYDADLEKAKKLIKQIGRDLAADPELGPNILEPLKMQGVEAFGDYAIQIRLKMMTRPGEQFVIRRRANALIKKAFDENGIAFAKPVVQVAGGEGAGDAAAARAFETARKAAADEAAKA
jgi:small-conductance mechanosensitive channel